MREPGKYLRILLILLVLAVGLHFGIKKADAIANQQELKVTGGSVDFNGSGDEVLNIDDTIPGQLYSLTAFTTGLAEIRIRNGAGELFVPELIGKYSNIYILRGDGPYTIDIDTESLWNVRVSEIENFTGDELSFKGSGYGVTPLFPVKDGCYNFITTGTGHLSVFLYYDGVQSTLLRNETEPCSKYIDLDGLEGKEAMFIVYSDGDWEIAYKAG